MPVTPSFRIDWVEILEPRSGEKMFVNLVSGDCGWDEPRGVAIKRLHEQDGHQWWELFDSKTSRFYYYNATTQQTCWQKPKSSSAIIIPLAKFQLLKQTNGASSPLSSNHNGHHSSSNRRSFTSKGNEMKDVSCQTRTSCTVTVNNSTQTTPPPSLRRNMVHYSYYGAAGGAGLNDTWSTKRSLRSYLINEARSARGLSGVAGQEDASDFDDEVWESDDDYEDESTTSDQWDADDEHDQAEVDDEDDFDDDEEDIEHQTSSKQTSKSQPVVTRSESEFEEYETEEERRTDSRAEVSADNQSSIGETYVDTSFVFVPTETSTWNRNEQKKEKLKHSQTLHEDMIRKKSEGRNGSFSGSDHGAELNRRGSTGKTGPPSYIPSPPSSSWTDRKPHPPPHQQPPPPPPPARGHSLNNSESFSRSRDVPTNTSSPSSSLVSTSSRPSPHSHIQLGHQSMSRHRDQLHSFTPPAPPQGFTSPVDKESPSSRSRNTSEVDTGRSTSKPVKESKKQVTRNEKKSPASSAGSKSKSPGQEKDHGIMEKFARENVVRHIKRGVGNQLLKRKTSLKAMLTWSKNSIRQPMIATLTTMSSSSKNEIKTEAIQCFKLIQQFMGDRALSSKDNSMTSGSTIGAAKEIIAFELVTLACLRHELRDEIYVQLCRQTTNNPRKSSLVSGFELMACCLCYFPPSVKFSPYLASFLANSPAKEVEITCKEDEETISLIEHCYRLLVKVRGIHLAEGALNNLTSSGVIYCRKPVTPKELEMVMESIERRFVGIFGESIDSLLRLQARRWPTRRLPWILTTLCEAILKMGGAGIEGIFRIAADTDELSFIKLVIDCINFDLLDDDGDILELLNHNTDEPVDVHVFACLLKQWFRSLKDPIIPYELYDECLESSSSRREIAVIVLEKLPKENKLVLGYLIRFLQVFAAPENANLTKMDDSNLSMIWAPNILRSTQSIMNPFGMHPSTVFENTRKEMTFIRTLIQTLDTSFIQGVYWNVLSQPVCGNSS